MEDSAANDTAELDRLVSAVAEEETRLMIGVVGTSRELTMLKAEVSVAGQIVV